MKKILIISSVLAALACAVSCNMELRPAGTVEPGNALQTITDAEKLRDGLYVAFRSRVGGTYASLDEIRSDLFHASTGFGNAGGSLYGWYMAADLAEIESIWGASYNTIANANFFIEKADAVNTSEWSEEDIANLEVWKGEAYFLRAYYHLELAEMFCKTYVGNEQSYGIPYVTSYTPTSDQTRYPDRGTLEHTFEMIVSDLATAQELITTPGQKGSDRITKDAVTALQARVALEMGNYDLAVEKSSELINSGTYPLVNSETAFQSMWVNDSGDECILQLFASYPNELGASNDYGYIGYDANKGIYQPYYYPEQWVVDLFEQIPDDWRMSNHLRWTTVTVQSIGNFDMYILYKFQGNPALRQNDISWNYQNKPKVFRIAEMYLIRAEALAKGGAPQAGASDPWADLYTLRSARATNYQPNQNGESIEDAILNERVRELIGEGFRIQDLKRFGRGFTRTDAQVRNAIYQPDTYTDFEVSPENGRFIFPIPQAEIDANPNIAGQQNPEY